MSHSWLSKQRPVLICYFYVQRTLISPSGVARKVGVNDYVKMFWQICTRSENPRMGGVAMHPLLEPIRCLDAQRHHPRLYRGIAPLLSRCEWYCKPSISGPYDAHAAIEENLSTFGLARYPQVKMTPVLLKRQSVHGI